MVDDKLSETSFYHVPSAIRVLAISADGDGLAAWLSDCVDDDSASTVDVEHGGLQEAITRLRQEIFDSVVIHHDGASDTLASVQAVRTASPEDLAIIVVAEDSATHIAEAYLAASADACVCRDAAAARSFVSLLARAVERQRLLKANRVARRTLDEQRKKHHQDAIHQLRAQRSLLLEYCNPAIADPQPPAWLVEHFGDLLQIYVVTGTGRLRSEVAQLTVRLRKSEVTLSEALSAHSLAAEKLVLSLGNRPAWHILGRAHLLAYELVMQWQYHGEAA